MGDTNYADGSVHTLTGGSSELNTVLGAAARRSQLVLVDYSASWCGPCRMMKPVLAALAGEHRGRLAVLVVDCEQTAANQALAATAGVRAFPTFHLYRAQQRVAELRGANPGGLRAAIEEQLRLLGPAQASGGLAMVNAVAAALARVKAGCSYDEFVAAARTLLTFVGNVVDHPGDAKYRRVKADNAAYRSRLGCRPGGKEAMAALGFREMVEAGQTVLLLSDVDPELPRVRQLLQSALQQAEAAAAGAAAAERRTQAAPAPAAAAAPGPAAPAAAAAAPVATAAPATDLSRPAPASSSSSRSAVDAAALAAALASALRTTSDGAGGSGVTAGPAAPVVVGRRVLRPTPRVLARMLARAMVESGVAQQPGQQQQQQQQQQQSSPPAE